MKNTRFYLPPKKSHGGVIELSPRGSRRRDYFKIKELFDAGESISSICRQVGVARQSVYNLIEREGWKK